MTEPAREEPRDCSGGLEGVLVSTTFWPACGNCVHKAYCWERDVNAPNPDDRPYHPAFPHTWEWCHAGLSFPEGHDHTGAEVGVRLLTQSWVGSGVYGQAHTSCYEYRVNPRYTVPATALYKYTVALRLWRRNHLIEPRIREIEAKWPERDFPLAVEQEWSRLSDELDANLARINELCTLPKGQDCEPTRPQLHG